MDLVGSVFMQTLVRTVTDSVGNINNLQPTQFPQCGSGQSPNRGSGDSHDPHCREIEAFLPARSYAKHRYAVAILCICQSIWMSITCVNCV